MFDDDENGGLGVKPQTSVKCEFNEYRYFTFKLHGHTLLFSIICCSSQLEWNVNRLSQQCGLN